MTPASSPKWKFTVVAVACASLAVPCIRGAEGPLILRAPSTEPRIRIERLPVPGSAGLTTVFLRSNTGSEVPVVGFLTDDLGGADRLSDVWVFTYNRPTLVQRLCAVLPFPFIRAGRHAHRTKPPKAFLDAAAPYRRAVESVTGMALRSQLVNPSGLTARAPLLSYESNITEHRRLHLFEALTVLRTAEGTAGGDGSAMSAELKRVESRLALSDRPFGDLVSERRLPEYHQRERAQLEEDRAHNWDLLRQKAETDGLYFQPIASNGARAPLALLWISLRDLNANRAAPQRHAFDGSLIGISNPWTDAGLISWEGYTQTRSTGDDSSNEETMIPLALYSLDHPRAPFLLVDFRDAGHARRDELGRRALEDVPRAVLGFALFANWEYHVANAAWSFVRRRHGAAMTRGYRTRAYAEARWDLEMNSSLQPALREELARRLDALSLNPIREDRRREAAQARGNYQLLAGYAESPNGLAARLRRDRGAEMTQLAHGRPIRVLLTTANVATLGMYRHRENGGPVLLARLEERRRLQARMDALRAVLASSPRVEVVADMNVLRSAVEDLASAGRDAPSGRARLVGELVVKTGDDEARMEFLSALQRMHDPSSRRELARLGADPALPEAWRIVCRDFSSRPADAGVAAGSLVTEGH